MSNPISPDPIEAVRGKPVHVLVIDDREDLARFCERVMPDPFAFEHVTGGRQAEPLLKSGKFAAVLVDRDFTRGDGQGLVGPPEDVRNEGLHILRWLRREYPRLPMLMITGYRDQKTALEAAELDTDFLAWQDIIDDPDILRARLLRALAAVEDQAGAVLGRFREQGIVVESPGLTRALVALNQAIPGDAPILLLGETGTGKDELAFAVHALSGDSGRPFISTNVAALSPGLIESELFGHARGAFTSADRAAIGKLRHADGGTFFLNEVGDLPLEAQAKLLTAVERHEVVPVGDVQSYPARFRLIAATSRDLLGMVEEGRFRRDLFHRLAWHTIEIPPLRARREDVPPLVRAFLRRSGQGTAEGVAGITQEAMEYLCLLSWEGNVRELKAVVEAASAVASYIITLADVREVVRRHERAPSRAADNGPGAVPGPASEQPAPGGPAAAPAGTATDRQRCEAGTFGDLSYREMMVRYFDYLYRKTGGRLPELARLAGIAKATAYEWKEKYGGGAEPPPGARPDTGGAEPPPGHAPTC